MPEDHSIIEDLIIQPHCSGNGGSIEVSVTGGTTPYVYSWDSGQVSEDISGLTPGDYQLTVTMLQVVLLFILER